jgi:cytochrome c oxidase cbb3-type subunit 3
VRSHKTTAYEHGREIYNFRCYFCHGYSGNAKTLASTFLSPQPRDFTATSPSSLTRSAMIEAVTKGRPDTAMMAFKTILTREEIEAVVDFVRQEFMFDKNPNTKYHTAENGWENHKKYAIAYPFALGEISIDTPWDDLAPEQQKGKRLFMTSCITCHDRGKVNDEGKIWELRPLSFPRNRYNHKATQKQIGTDANSGASPYFMMWNPKSMVCLRKKKKVRRFSSKIVHFVMPRMGPEKTGLEVS